ncbi:MuF-like minor capsid protein [Gordonia phage LittleFella]|nr:MuF-like minor capsid protein [Gordonia phage LittleFella]
MRGLNGKPGVGAGVRRGQLLASRSVLLQVIRKLFLEVGNVIRADQANAARLAADLLFEDEKGIWRVVEPDKDRREEIRLELRTTAARNVQSMMTRILETERPLSARVYKSEALAKKQVQNAINRNLAIGASADDLARDVRKLIDPNVPGGVSYRAKTLARTEINNAFHAQSINDMRERPWIEQAQWNLSKSHNEEGCVCEQYARTRLFPVDRVPKKPHPGCLCSITPYLPDFDTALKNFLSGQYSPWLP